MAASVGIPVVAIFGPTDPARWAPKGRKVTLIRRAISCSPCARETMSDCELRPCLSEIPVGDVYHAVNRIIEQRGEEPYCSSVCRNIECEESGATSAPL